MSLSPLLWKSSLNYVWRQHTEKYFSKPLKESVIEPVKVKDCVNPESVGDECLMDHPDCSLKLSRPATDDPARCAEQ